MKYAWVLSTVFVFLGFSLLSLSQAKSQDPVATSDETLLEGPSDSADPFDLDTPDDKISDVSKPSDSPQTSGSKNSKGSSKGSKDTKAHKNSKSTQNSAEDSGKVEKFNPKGDDDQGYGKPRGLLGPVTFGPIVGVGLPMPLSAGLELKYANLLGLSADIARFPAIVYSSVDIEGESSRLALRWFPFWGSFFVGVGTGSYKIKGSKTETISGQKVKASAELTARILTPHLGWRWVWAAGFFLGMELGVQIPSGVSTKLTSDAPSAIQSTSQYIELEKQVKDQSNALGNIALPHIALLQMGWYF